MADTSSRPERPAATLGFKQLTLDNWTEADPVNSNFARISPFVGPIQMDQGDWARQFLAVDLSDDVPPEIRDLFAIARGAMLYGWFFYPLFRLGEEQLYRVLEAAARLRYQQLLGENTRLRYEQLIELLAEREAIPPEEVERWTAARHLRNNASHPERAAVVPPGFALRMLQRSATDIQQLFANPD